MATAAISPTLGTRAALRTVAPGEMAHCAGCGFLVKFQAQKKNHRIVANVYKRRRWDRVEIWHPRCYEQAGQPHGEAVA